MKETTMEHLNMISRNLALAALVAFAVWYTRSAWPMLGLVFLVGWKHTSGVCPKCKEKVEFQHEDESRKVY